MCLVRVFILSTSLLILTLLTASPTTGANFPREDDINRLLRTEQIKMELMEKLNLKSPPNISKDDHPSQFTLQALKKRYGIIDKNADFEEPEDKTVKTKQILTIAKPVNGPNGTSGHGCSFQLTDEERSCRAQRALLWMYVEADHNRTEPTFVHVTLINQRPDGSRTFGPRRSVKITSQGAHWKPINVATYMNKWLTRRSNQQMIVIADSNIVKINDVEKSSPYRPYIQATLVKDPIKRRRKRSVVPDSGRGCHGQDYEKWCCMYDLHINFRTVKWDWIIYPESFNARYCTGGCNYFIEIESTRKQIIYQAALQNPEKISKKAKESCCIPSATEAISVLYYDQEGNIVYTNVDGMMIRSCSCA